MSDSKTRDVVVSALEVRTRDGKTHKSDAKVTLPDVEARDLIRAGLVREAGTSTTEKKGA